MEISRLVRGHVRLWETCTRCQVGTWARNHVFWRGVLPCDVLWVGEGPGIYEDEQGLPFVGPSGALLDQLITEAGFDTLRNAITNVVVCRACDGPNEGNRAPNKDEVQNCLTRLEDFIQIARPMAMVTIGKVAERQCTRWTLRRACIRHPAYILRKGGLESEEYRQALDELILFRSEL